MMRQPASAPMVLAEGTEFSRGHRIGRVYRSSPNGCEVVWHEVVDPESGEITRAIADFIPAEQIGREVSLGAIRIRSLPEPMTIGVGSVLASPPTIAELARASHRECYILAAQSQIEEGNMRPRKADFVRNYAELRRLGLGEASARASRASPGAKCGTRLVILRPPQCGETIYRWWRTWDAAARTPRMDAFRNCGRRPGGLYTDDENEFYKNVIAVRLTEERPSIASIFQSVQAAVRCENRRRLALVVPEAELAVPGYNWVWQHIARMAPVITRYGPTEWRLHTVNFIRWVSG